MQVFKISGKKRVSSQMKTWWWRFLWCFIRYQGSSIIPKWTLSIGFWLQELFMSLRTCYFPVWSMALPISVKNNNNYWTRLNKIYIVICQWWADQYLPKLNAKSNNIDLRVRKVCFLKNIFGKRSNLPFSCKSDCKKEKSLVSFTHEQNIICSQKKMDNIVHIKQTIICRQLFAGHMVRSPPMKRKKNLQWMIIIFIFNSHFSSTL